MRSAARRRVCFPFVGDTVGGSHLSALTLIEELNRSGDVEALVVVHEPGPLADHLDERGWPYATLRLAAYVGRGERWRDHLVSGGRALAPLGRFLRDRDVAVVHTNDARMHLTWAAPTRLAGAGFVWHQRTRFPRSRLLAAGIHAAHRVVAISTYVASTLPDRVARATFVIPNPIASPAAASEARHRLSAAFGRRPTGPVVGFVGNLTRQKRPEQFLEAAARIAEEVPNSLFVMIGDDRDGLTARLRAQANGAGMADRVELLGLRVPAADWIPGFDLLLAPGVGEGSGRGVLEAMSGGVPVVATASGGHVEILRDEQTGWLVPPDDPGAMAEAAVAVLRDPTGSRAVADRAAAQVRSRHAPHRHAELVRREVYEPLLRNP